MSSNSNLIDILFIGHTTKDEITINSETQKIPGGGVYFGSLSAGYCQINKNYKNSLEVLTIGNSSDLERTEKEMEKASIKLHIIPDSHTTTFCHSFIDNDPDKRVSTIPCIARSFKFEDIEKFKAKFFYVNPLFYGEVPHNLFKDLKERCEILSVDAQGLLRNFNKGEIELKAPKELAEILKYVDVLKVDIAEALSLTDKNDWEESCKHLLTMGPKYVICTRTNEVSVLVKDENGNVNVYTSMFGEWSLIGRTGRGDTISAAFILMHFINNVGVQEALDVAAKATGKKMMHAGAAVKEDFE
jgi:sugar/nucleoside kinase (ribokinase family)